MSYWPSSSRRSDPRLHGRWSVLIGGVRHVRRRVEVLHDDGEAYKADNSGSATRVACLALALGTGGLRKSSISLAKSRDTR
jgi:hypothetical protein